MTATAVRPAVLEPGKAGTDMILLVVTVMALLGATTWLVLNQSVARNPALRRQLTAAGLGLCLAAGLTAVIASLG